MFTAPVILFGRFDRGATSNWVALGLLGEPFSNGSKCLLNLTHEKEDPMCRSWSALFDLDDPSGYAIATKV